MTEKRCYTVKELQEILGVSRQMKGIGCRATYFIGEDDEIMKNSEKIV